MAKTALCIGINDYPGTQNDLSGCINDANDWAAVLDGRGFAVTTLLDNKATKAAMVEAMGGLIDGARAGDSVVLTYSGHGTFVPDANGDEPDGNDEGLCPYDIGKGHVLLDDEIHELFAARRAGVRIVLLSDSCHSGSVIRWAGTPEPGMPRARFLPPGAWLPTDKLPRSANGEVPTRQARAAKGPGWMGSLSLAGGDLLLSGCQDEEYSYDAYFGGRPNGAFTKAALKTLKTLSSAATYADWHKAIRATLPSSSYPQTPQIFGTRKARSFKVLA